jgi:hypothetical protein
MVWFLEGQKFLRRSIALSSETQVEQEVFPRPDSPSRAMNRRAAGAVLKARSANISRSSTRTSRTASIASSLLIALLAHSVHAAVNAASCQ